MNMQYQACQACDRVVKIIDVYKIHIQLYKAYLVVMEL